MIKVHDKVLYLYTVDKKYTYEIISVDSGQSLKNSHYVFGYDDNDFPMNSFDGKFDFVLAEYDENGNFVKNIACTIEEIELKQ